MPRDNLPNQRIRNLVDSCRFRCVWKGIKFLWIIGVTLFPLWLQCQQWELGEEARNLQTSMGYHPRLASGDFWRDGLGLQFVPVEEGSAPFEIEGISVRGGISYVNEGNALAIHTFSAYGLARTAEPILRDSLLSGQLTGIQFAFDSLNVSPFGMRHVPPGDTLQWKVELELRHLPPRRIAYLHHLILYENEYGNLFDTYQIVGLWPDTTLVLNLEWRVSDSALQVRAEGKVGRSDWEGALRAFAAQPSFRTYTAEESEMLLRSIERISNGWR